MTMTMGAVASSYTVPAAPGGPIAFGSISNTTYASRTNTTITAPAGIANGDLLLFFIATANGSGDAPDPTPPAGLTAIGTETDVTNGGFNIETRTYYKVASSESGSYTFTHSTCSSQGISIRYTGVNTTTPLDTTATQNTGNSQTATATGLTTASNGAWIVFFEHSWDGSGALLPPTGMTERHDAGLCYVADETRATAGATGNRSHSVNISGNSVWAARLIALRSA